MSRRRRLSSRSRSSAPSSRSIIRSRWRSVSTTSIASISSSSGARSRSASPDAVVLISRARVSSSFCRGRSVDIAGGSRTVATTSSSSPRRLDRERLPFGDELRQPPLALLDRLADLLGVARALLAHLGDDRAGVLLEADDRVDELLHGLGADRRPVAGLERRLLHFAADLREVLEAAADPFLHRVDGLRALVQSMQPGERRAERGEHRLVRAEEAHGLLVDAILRARRLQQAAHDDLRRVVSDREVVGEVLADLVTVLGGLDVAQPLVARELEAGPLHGIGGRVVRDRLHRRLELRLACLEMLLRGLEHLEGEDLGLLQRAAKILIRRKNELLALDLIARIARDVEIGFLDL